MIQSNKVTSHLALFAAIVITGALVFFAGKTLAEEPIVPNSLTTELAVPHEGATVGEATLPSDVAVIQGSDGNCAVQAADDAELREKIGAYLTNFGCSVTSFFNFQ